MIKADMPTSLSFDLDIFLDDEPGFNMPNNIGVVLNGDIDFDLNKFALQENITYWIAVDGGYNHLKKYLIEPDILIGDLDSLNNDHVQCEVIQFDVEKDETDFVLALDYIKKNYNNSNIHVVGINSNKRLEHTYANLKNLTSKMTMYTKYNKIMKLRQNHTISKENHDHFSIFTPSRAMGVTITGSKYDVELIDIDSNNTIGISNEFAKPHVCITYNTGELIVFLSNEQGYYE